MNLNRFLLPIAAVCGLIAVSTIIFLQMAQRNEEPLASLKLELNALREQIQSRELWARHSGSSEGHLPERAPAPATDSADLPNQVADLAANVAHLEAVIRNLNERISRAGLAPSPAESNALIEHLRPEVDRHSQKAQNELAQVKMIAARFNVQWEDAMLAGLRVPPSLENYPPFVEARTRAIQAQRVADALKIRYSSEMFQSASNVENVDGSGRRVPSEVVRLQLETQMRQQADRVQSTMTEVRNIAARFKVDLDERAFTGSKVRHSA